MTVPHTAATTLAAGLIASLFAFSTFVLAGCATHGNVGEAPTASTASSPPADTPPTPAPPAPAGTSEPAAPPAPAASSEPAAPPAPAGGVEPAAASAPAAPAAPGPAAEAPAAVTPSAPSATVPPPAAPASKDETVAKASPAPTVAPPKPAVTPKPAPPSPLDLAGLEKRLRDTKAIGVFTKLSLKNQVDDLLEQFKTFHQGQGTPTLAALREQYNLLMLKVLSLLQRDDPSLARDLTASRDAIWGVLTDRVKFAKVVGG